MDNVCGSVKNNIRLHSCFVKKKANDLGIVESSYKYFLLLLLCKTYKY
jgi:hypothetical protein